LFAASSAAQEAVQEALQALDLKEMECNTTFFLGCRYSALSRTRDADGRACALSQKRFATKTNTNTKTTKTKNWRSTYVGGGVELKRVSASAVWLAPHVTAIHQIRKNSLTF